MTNMRDIILLDSDSTDTVFCNPRYVKNIRNSKQVLTLNTNGGKMVSNQVCEVPHLGTHWFNKDSITNIISLDHMTDKFRVTLDSNEEKALLVHFPDKIIKFHQMENGLYGMNPMIDYNNSIQKFQLIQTVGNNWEYLTTKQKNRVKKAQKLYEAIGTN